MKYSLLSVHWFVCLFSFPSWGNSPRSPPWAFLSQPHIPQFPCWAFLFSFSMCFWINSSSPWGSQYLKAIWHSCALHLYWYFLLDVQQGLPDFNFKPILPPDIPISVNCINTYPVAQAKNMDVILNASPSLNSTKPINYRVLLILLLK